MGLRVVFFGNSASTFSVRYFAALLDEPCKVVGAIDVPTVQQTTTNPLETEKLNFVSLARDHAIPVYQPSNPNAPTFAAELEKLEADLLVAVGYPMILKERLLASPSLLAVNFHASLLPDYRGKHPVFWALRNNEKWSGISVHVMDPGIDTGDIIYQVKTRVHRDDSVTTLYERIIRNSVSLVGRLIVDAEANTIPRRPQPVNSGSYFSSTSEEDFQINWSWSAEKIRHFITITPGKCYATLKGRKVYFFDAKKGKLKSPSAPGTLLKIKIKSALVAAGSGGLSISQVQLESREIESFASLCRREGFIPGEHLSK
jgi:methionyl-tRNA formyltransferase